MTPTGADTIVALATPAGGATRAILRMSGPNALELAAAILVSSPERPARNGPVVGDRKREPEALRVSIRLGDLTIPATLLCFYAPRSSTGEDVVEFNLPGSPWIVSRTLEALFSAGARQAEAGEFTSRAFVHGKLDLAAAEGVVATIEASNRQGLSAARQLLAGELSRRLRPLLDRLTNALALVEVGIDFSEEDVSFIERDTLRQAIGEACSALLSLKEESSRFERLNHEPRIVLAGRPNAGKSSLLNALACKTRSIVADIEGTTRDAISERVALCRGYITLVDVAGIGDEPIAAETHPYLPIDDQMRHAAHREIAQADYLVLAIAADDVRRPIKLTREPDLVVWTKADLCEVVVGLRTSVHTTDGLLAFRDALDSLAFGANSGDSGGKIALNARHRAAIDESIAALKRARDAIDLGNELIAAELRGAIGALSRVLGKVSPDEVLGKIFTGFCIGK